MDNVTTWSFMSPAETELGTTHPKKHSTLQRKSCTGAARTRHMTHICSAASFQCTAAIHTSICYYSTLIFKDWALDLERQCGT